MGDKNKDSKLRFSSGQRIANSDGFPGAVQKSLDQFIRQSFERLPRHEATIVATVAVPKDGCYFAVVLAGPFGSLEALRAALSEVPKEQLSHIERLGIE